MPKELQQLQSALLIQNFLSSSPSPPFCSFYVSQCSNAGQGNMDKNSKVHHVNHPLPRRPQGVSYRTTDHDSASLQGSVCRLCYHQPETHTARTQKSLVLKQRTQRRKFFNQSSFLSRPRICLTNLTNEMTGEIFCMRLLPRLQVMEDRNKLSCFQHPVESFH